MSDEERPNTCERCGVPIDEEESVCAECDAHIHVGSCGEDEPRDTLPMRPALTCAYCDGHAEGNYSIHRDGYGEGPEVPLCDDHGSGEEPTCATVWARIAAKVSQ